MFSDTFTRSAWICAIAVLFPTITQPAALANSDTGDGPGTGDDGSGTDSGDAEERREEWLFVDIPRFGMASLQEVLELGSPANLAFENIAEPLESYEPISLYAPVANVHNGAVVVMMLPERCMGDFNEDGRVDLYDVVPFTLAFIEMDPSADLTRNGRIDIQDQILFLQLATMPCVNGW